MKANGQYGDCAIKNCPRRRRLRSPLCKSCSASINGYWGHKTPADILARQTQLEKWQDRMQYLGTKVESKIRRFRNVAKFIQKRRT